MTTSDKQQKQRSCLYDIGWIKQKGEWLRELKEFSGQSYIPMAEMDSIMRSQLKDGTAYVIKTNEGWKCVSEVAATHIRLETGIRTTAEKSDGKCRAVIICFEKNEYGLWAGITFELGDEVAIEQDGQGDERRKEEFTRDVFFKPESMLKELADIAVQEAWQNEYSPYGLLMPYIKYIYTKLKKDGKVAIIADDGVMAFNTGLVSRYKLNSIIAVCRENEPGRGQRWSFDRYLIWGQSKLPRDRHLMNLLHDCPNPPDWFGNINKTVLNADAIDLSEETFSSLKKSEAFSAPIEILEAMAKADCNDVVLDKIGKLRAMYKANKIAEADMRKNLYNDIVSKMGGREEVAELAVDEFLKPKMEMAIKRLKWEIGTAVPIWNLSRNDGAFDFILPLAFGEDPMKVDIALVLEPNGSGKYIPAGDPKRMFLSLRSAYSYARLLRRPEAFWLREYIEN